MKNIGYFISQAFKSFFRNGVMSTASVIVLMSCLTVIGAFSGIILNLNYNLENIGALNEIVVFCKSDATEQEVTAVGNAINALDNIKSSEYISKEQALQEEIEKYSSQGYTDLAEQMKQFTPETNPYMASYIVIYNDNAKVDSLKFDLEQIEGVDKVSSHAEVAERVESLKSGITVVFVWFMVILFVVSMFVIINTIKLAVFARHREIEIARYVGATNSFITIPFTIEGMIIGLLAGGIGYLIMMYIYKTIQGMLEKDYSNLIYVIPFSNVSLYYLLGFLAVGLIAGTLGSTISTRRYLKA